MKTNRTLISVLTFVLVGLMLVGCTAASATQAPSQAEAAKPATADAPAQATAAPAAAEPAAAEPASAAASTKYKVPTVAYETWQEYTPEQFAAEDVSAKAVAYQFSGSKEAERNVSVLMNLYDDGFVTMDQYVEDGTRCYRYYGYWANLDDAEVFLAHTCYQYVMPDNEAYGYVNGALATLDYSYDLVDEGNGFIIPLNICLGFGDGGLFVRSMDLSSDGSIVYADENAFVEYVHETWGAAEAEAPTETAEAKPAEAAAEGDAFAYPEHAMSIAFTADINEQLTTVFWADKSVWGLALTTYAQTDTHDELLVFENAEGKPFGMTLFTDGTYEFSYPAFNLTEAGTFTFENYSLTLTTSNGVSFTSEIH